jgi:hypothetical protein
MCIPMGGQSGPQTPTPSTLIIRPTAKDLPLGDGLAGQAGGAIKKRKQSIDDAIKAAGG